MTTNISQLDVSLDEDQEASLLLNGFQKVDVNVNEGTSGNPIYLWFKSGPNPITRVQLAFNDKMSVGLENAGYLKISKNLNTGNGGDPIYLLFFKGNTKYDIPIQQIDVTADATTAAKKFTADWERLACDLNRGAGGKQINAWVKREKPTYICNVSANASYHEDESWANQGFIRVDEDVNKGTGGVPIFIWYCLTTDPSRALNRLQVSITKSQMTDLHQQQYFQVAVNLNEKTFGVPVYLWFKKEGSDKPVKAISVLLEQAQIEAFTAAGVNVIKRNLNQGTTGQNEYLCVNQ